MKILGPIIQTDSYIFLVASALPTLVGYYLKLEHRLIGDDTVGQKLGFHGVGHRLTLTTKLFQVLFLFFPIFFANMYD